MKQMWAAIKSWFMADKQHRATNLVFSLVFLLLSFACFYFEPQASNKHLDGQAGDEEKTNIVRKVITSVEKQAGISERTNVFHETVTTIASHSTMSETSNVPCDSGGLSKWCDHVGLGLLILSVWMWRKELGINSMFGLGAKEADIVPQQDPSKSKALPSGSVPPTDDELKTAASHVEDDKTKAQVERVLGLFKRRHAINTAVVANELGINHSEAEKLLLILRHAGVLRADGVPKATMYTWASSIENRTLDCVRERVASEHNLLSERRFVRIGRIYDVDSILSCEDRVFVVEVKYQQTDLRTGYLDTWCLQLLNMAKEVSDKPVGCILAIACSEAAFARVKQQAESTTLYGGKIPLQIMVLCEDELRKMRKG